METRAFSIGETAKATGLSVKTIRYYEHIGLIPKAPRHDSTARTGGNRVYSEGVIGRLQFIHHARMLDLSLEDVRDLLVIADKRGCPGEQPDYQRILVQHLEEINKRIAHLLGLRERIEDLMSPERPRAGEACFWNTCTCMQPDAASTSSTETGTAHNVKDGGNHV